EAWNAPGGPATSLGWKVATAPTKGVPSVALIVGTTTAKRVFSSSHSHPGRRRRESALDLMPPSRRAPRRLRNDIEHLVTSANRAARPVTVWEAYKSNTRRAR